MDENETIEAPVGGGLSQVAPKAAPAAAPAPATPQPSEYQKAIADLQKQRLEVIAQSKRLADSLEARIAGPSEMLFALSSAFGRPTRTGSFGESLGYATEALGQFQTQQRQQMSDVAKMRLELQMQELAMKEKDAGSAFLRDRQAGRQTPVAGGSQAPSGVGGAQQPAPAGQQGSFRDMTGEDIAMISRTNPDLAKSISDAIKMDQDRFVIAQNGAVFDRRAGTYVNQPVPGQVQSEYSTPYGTFKMTPSQYAAFELAQQSGQGRQWMEAFRVGRPFSPSGAPQPGTSGEPGVPSGGIKTVREAEIEAAAQKKEAEGKGEYGAGRRTSVMTVADLAPRLQTLADQNIEIIQNNPDAVGILAKPGITNAILSVVSQAKARATQSGEIVLDTSSLEEAVRRAGPKKMMGETDEAYNARVQRNIDAASVIARNLAEMELYAAKSFLKGQGAVANMERLIVQKLGGNLSDSRNALLAKNEITKITSKYDQMVRDAMIDWEDENKGVPVERFFTRDQRYKDLVKAYNDEIKGLTERYFPAPKAKSGEVRPGAPSNLRDRLKKEYGI
jgi:hypothetical protein